MAAGLAVFSLPVGLFLQTLGLILFGEGLMLVLFGGAIGAGLWFKIYNTAWLRAQKQAIREELKTYHEELRDHTVAGLYLALAGVIAMVAGLTLCIL